MDGQAKDYEVLQPQIQRVLKMLPSILQAYPWILEGQMEDILVLDKIGLVHILSFLGMLD